MNVKRLRRYVGRRCLLDHLTDSGVAYTGTIAAVEGDVIELENVEFVRNGAPQEMGGVLAVVVGPGMSVQVI